MTASIGFERTGKGVPGSALMIRGLRFAPLQPSLSNKRRFN